MTNRIYAIEGTKEINAAAIPTELKQLKQWVAWRGISETEGKKPRKMPMSPYGGCARSNDSSTWATYDEAWNTAAHEGYAGIGYVFSLDDPYAGVDIDHCINPATGDFNSETARELVKGYGSYCEISPSGTGVKLIFKSSIKASKKDFLVFGNANPDEKISVETYAHGRFFTITGKTLPGMTEIKDCSQFHEHILGKFANWEPKETTTTTQTVAPIVPIILDDEHLAWEAGRMRAALKTISSENEGVWHNILCSIKHWGAVHGRDDLAKALFEEWSITSDKYDQGELDSRWARVFPDGGLTAGSIYHEAFNNGWDNTAVGADGKPLEDPSAVIKDWGTSSNPDAISDARRKLDAEVAELAVKAGGGSSKARLKPWEATGSYEVRQAIKGTRLERIVQVLESVSVPPLPIQLTLPKALSMAGVALSQAKNTDWKTAQKTDDGWGNQTVQLGAEWLKVRIATGGKGQACNVWSLTVAETGCGKDIGDIPASLSAKKGWLIGSGGSAEGMKDSLMEIGSGLLIISELRPYLDPNRWQGKVTDWLTDSFSKGWFRDPLSKKGQTKREANFCYTSVIANVQPAVIDSVGDSILQDSGFMPRFLISTAPTGRNWRPKVGDIDFREAWLAMEEYSSYEGVVNVPQDYLDVVHTEFQSHGALPSIYGRLVNEYGARFAVMLAEDPLNPDQEAWDRSGVLVRWFYGMAEKVVLGMQVDAFTQKMNKSIEKYMAWFRQNAPCTRHDFSRRWHKTATADQRERALKQMEGDGLITITPGEKQGWIIRVVENPGDPGDGGVPGDGKNEGESTTDPGVAKNSHKSRGGSPGVALPSEVAKSLPPLDEEKTSIYKGYSIGIIQGWRGGGGGGCQYSDGVSALAPYGCHPATPATSTTPSLFTATQSMAESPLGLVAFQGAEKTWVEYMGASYTGDMPDDCWDDDFLAPKSKSGENHKSPLSGEFPSSSPSPKAPYDPDDPNAPENDVFDDRYISKPTYVILPPVARTDGATKKSRGLFDN